MCHGFQDLAFSQTGGGGLPSPADSFFTLVSAIQYAGSLKFATVSQCYHPGRFHLFLLIVQGSIYIANVTETVQNTSPAGEHNTTGFCYVKVSEAGRRIFYSSCVETLHRKVSQAEKCISFFLLFRGFAWRDGGHAATLLLICSK